MCLYRRYQKPSLSGISFENRRRLHRNLVIDAEFCGTKRIRINIYIQYIVMSGEVYFINQGLQNRRFSKSGFKL